MKRLEMLKIMTNTNYILTRLYETCNEELKKEYYEMRTLFLDNFERIQDDKNNTDEYYFYIVNGSSNH